MNFVCIVFELGDKMLTLSSMENLIVQCNLKVYSRHPGHMTKMAATPIYGKNPSKNFFSGTGGPISLKLGMFYPRLLHIIVCSNDDP